MKIPKLLLLICKFIATFSAKLSILFTAKLFSTPLKHKTPKRELETDNKSSQKLIEIPPINKRVMIYEYWTSEKKILLLHGWSGRETQLFKIADELFKKKAILRLVFIQNILSL